MESNFKEVFFLECAGHNQHRIAASAVAFNGGEGRPLKSINNRFLKTNEENKEEGKEPGSHPLLPPPAEQQLRSRSRTIEEEAAAATATPTSPSAGMGTGSSSCSPARRWRRSRWGSESGSAPARPSRAEEQERADAGAKCSLAAAQPPLPPLGEPDSDSELLDQVLAECDADGPVQPPWQPRHPSRLAGHSSSSPAGGGKGDGARGDRQILLTRGTLASENTNFANNLPLQKAERKSKTSYDYSEVEMMAAIEQEYGR
ncbi:PREDICTED: cystin-1 [Gekko japonicus]|uniref:Cystin-1 n=1 Tax=Gekko japonicus TaxID=146911 RepID=A0ABM1JWF4_GEKJA|nr:PREDICTED: cystin-1 [Gekko japonicus]